VAAALAVFILYTSIAGAGTPQVLPSKLHQYAGKPVTLVGTVMSSRGDAHSDAGMRFVLRDPQDTSGRVMVVYHGTVPDPYKVGRFLAQTGSLSTKCPSKYTPAKSKT
jgi:cytochrome c-type biogenesis protein CcmE